MKKAIAIARVIVRKKGNNNNLEPNRTRSTTEDMYRDGLIVFGAFSAFLLAWGFACLLGAALHGGLYNLAKYWLAAITGI